MSVVKKISNLLLVADDRPSLLGRVWNIFKRHVHKYSDTPLLLIEFVFTAIVLIGVLVYLMAYFPIIGIIFGLLIIAIALVFLKFVLDD